MMKENPYNSNEYTKKNNYTELVQNEDNKNKSELDEIHEFMEE